MKIYRFLWVALLAVCFAACSDDDSNEPAQPDTPDLPNVTFEILSDPTTYSFTSAGNSAQVLRFNSDKKWTIELAGDSADYDWLTLFQREGDPGENIRVWIAAAQNNTYDSRSAEFTLHSGDNAKTFTIYQAQQDAVVITDQSAFENLDASEHIVPVDFKYNVEDYTVDISDKSWIEQTDEPANAKEDGTRAMVDKRIWLKINANNKFDLRRGSVTIRDKNNSSTSAILTIYQYGLAKPIINIDNASDFANLSSASQTLPIDLSTMNVADVVGQLTVDIPSADRDWLKLHVNNDSTGYNLEVLENTGGERSTTVSVCAKVDHSVKADLKITQQAADGVTVTVANKDALRDNLDKQGGSFSVKVNAPDENWDAKVESTDGAAVDWIRIVNKSGQVVLTYDENTNLRSRSAVIKVFPTGDENHADKVTITQAAGTTVILNGSLQNTLDALVADGIYSGVRAITKLELKGELSKDDWALLKNMLTSGKGYSLTSLDLSQVTNTSIAANQFNGCNQLKYLTLPAAMRESGERVCQNCTELLQVTIPEGPEYLCNHFFNGCTKLNEVWIPSTMKYLYASVFEKCTALRRIHLQCLPLQIANVGRSPSQPTSWSEPFMNTNNIFKSCTLYVPTEYVDYYKNPTPQHVVSLHIADYLKTLTETSDAWTKSVPTADGGDWLRGGSSSLKSSFSWTNATTNVQAEDNWNK